MKPEIKKLWIEALRSDEYKQDAMRLRTPRGHCCLGVLCDLHRRATGTEWDPSTDGLRECFRYLDHDVTLPDEVIAWAGLPTANPTLGGDETAAALNDRGMPFEAIADRIEKYL